METLPSLSGSVPPQHSLLLPMPLPYPAPRASLLHATPLHPSFPQRMQLSKPGRLKLRLSPRLTGKGGLWEGQAGHGPRSAQEANEPQPVTPEVEDFFDKQAALLERDLR